METTVRYRKNRRFEGILIVLAILAFGIAAFALSHGALSFANFSSGGNNPDPVIGNSTIISYVTVNHNYTTTSTKVVTTTVYSNNTVHLISTRTVTTTVTVKQTHSPPQPPGQG